MNFLVSCHDFNTEHGVDIDLLFYLCINFVLLACNYNITKEALKYIIISISARLRIYR